MKLDDTMKSHILIVLFLLGVPMLVFGVYTWYFEQANDLAILGPMTKDSDGGKVYHTISDFSFTDQNGRTVNGTDLEGEVYVANFFFTVCPTICPDMTNTLKAVQSAFEEEDGVVLISHSVDPGRDSVPVLHAYAEEFGIKPDKWHLVTGDKKEIYLMARNDYMLPVMEGDGGPFDFIHSERAVLIDKKGRIRGYYDATEKKEVGKLITDIEKLLKEK